MNNFERVDELLKEFEIKTHLDHVIKLAQEYLIKQDKVLLKDFKKRIRDKRIRDKNYKITEEEKRVLDFEKEGKYFLRIELHKKPDWDSDKGYVYMFDWGAQIYFASGFGHSKKHKIICHEIGHILLHTKRNPQTCMLEKSDFDKNMEAEATYFADEILKKLSEKFKEDDFLDSFEYKEETL